MWTERFFWIAIPPGASVRNGFVLFAECDKQQIFKFRVVSRHLIDPDGTDDA